MKDAPGTRDYDWWLIAILLAICTLGVIEIYSATQGSSLAGMHTKQIRWLALGFVLMFVLSRLDYHLILDQALDSLFDRSRGPGCGADLRPYPVWGQTLASPCSANFFRCRNW